MDRFKSTKIASMLGIIGNLFLLIIKGIVASLSGSQAMVADAFNSAGDIFSSLMTYVGNRISCKKADDDHNLGHGKAEYIYSMLISISMLLMATFVLKDSIKSLFYGSKYTFSIWLIVVCIVTIIVKFSLFLYTNTLYKKHNNLLILANSKDHLNDTIITSLNLISCVLSSYNIFFLDGIVGGIISIWIMYTAIKLFIESYNVLMDKSISIETKNKVLDIIKEEKQVKKVIHFNSTPVGYKYQISFTIYVDGNMSTFDSHEIANSLEEKIVDKVEEIYLVVIHVNPM
ncbi:cation diffusion facilitator family transporter [Clostridium sp. CAG:1000]|nr:cation diffusion facilitator family transporter [Clostridium sp. CAG:1000]